MFSSDSQRRAVMASIQERSSQRGSRPVRGKSKYHIVNVSLSPEARHKIARKEALKHAGIGGLIGGALGVISAAGGSMPDKVALGVVGGSALIGAAARGGVAYYQANKALKNASVTTVMNHSQYRQAQKYGKRFS